VTAGIAESAETSRTAMSLVTDAQVRKLMEEMSKHGKLGKAAMKAGMDRKTARKYVKSGKLPSEAPAIRDWRTRADPFECEWDKVVRALKESPGLEAKTIFEELCTGEPGKYEPGQLRTLQRKVRAWRSAEGPEKEVTLAQRHRPGEAAQTDFTRTGELGVTINGEALTTMLCVFVLPYSNWLWATVCQSESIAAIRKGVQRALFQLGRVPKYHQTDNSTAATHRIPDGKKVLSENGKRPFNADYVAIMRHFGMTPRTTEVGAKEQNGDVEAANGALKRRLNQALLIRGSRDFESVAAWQSFVDQVVRKANDGRGERIKVELEAMRELNVAKLADFVEDVAMVSEWSTIRVGQCAYSVPSRLIGEVLTVRLYEERLEAYFGGELQLACERLVGRNLRRIDYRHVIWSLIRKPGAFARYVYREEMFPSLAFRQAYDVIQSEHAGIKGDVEYLRILHLAASTMQSEVETALVLLLGEKRAVSSEAVKSMVLPKAQPVVPELTPLNVDLHTYDSLLGEVAA
jgi:transposase InsO family protein